MYTFSKNERLCNPVQISSLFKKGKTFSVGVLTFKYVKVSLDAFSQQEECCKTMVSVPKKIHKRAVSRNLLKRRMREAFRKNKEDLYDALVSSNCKIQLGIFYYGSQIIDSETIQKHTVKGLEQLTKIIKS